MKIFYLILFFFLLVVVCFLMVLDFEMIFEKVIEKMKELRGLRVV